MTVAEILRSKGDDVVTVPPGTPVAEVIRLLNEHNIGALVVIDDRIQGIISERDILRTAADDPRRLESALVDELMTRDVITCPPTARIPEIMNVMTENRIRHLPIASDDGGLVGMISIGDVVNTIRRVTEAENKHLHAYITGVPA
jgi:CBS domain-containing protein